jgi:hypothetical protein
MLTLLTSISVWYLILEKTVVPSPYMDKKECLMAGEEQYLSGRDAEGEGWAGYICVEGKLYD